MIFLDFHILLKAYINPAVDVLSLNLNRHRTATLREDNLSRKPKIRQ